MNRPSVPSTVVSVDLGPYAERARERVASGEFDSLDSLIRAALLALVSDRDETDDPQLEAWIRRRITTGDAAGDEGYPASEAFARIDAHIRARRRERDAA